MRKRLVIPGAKKSGRRVIKTPKGSTLVISGAKNLGRRVIKTSKGTALLVSGPFHITPPCDPQPPKPRPYKRGKKTGDKR